MLRSFFVELLGRNQLLVWFGFLNLILFLTAFILSYFDLRMVNGVNAWLKPMKFALSVMIFVFTMAWLLQYLPFTKSIYWVILIIVVTMTIEQLAIFMQAGRGITSHFNVNSGWFNAFIFQIMAIAITINTFAIAYVALLFFINPIELPLSYLWGIRLGLICFVLFSFEGFAMGAALKHTIGAADGVKGLPFLNWSINHGDLRIAHFIGLHALQVLPIVGYLVYLFNLNYLIAIGFGLLYAGFAGFAFIWALLGKSFF